jgi:hypothetical protein
VRVLCTAFVVFLGAAGTAHAQDPAPPQDDHAAPVYALERIRVALENPQPLVVDGSSLFTSDDPKTYHLGVLTFLTPDTRGEAVSVGVPIGELVMRAARSVTAVHHRHAEQAAKKEVAQALDDFWRAQQK